MSFVILADSAPFGLDTAWWTALATIVALILGLIGFFAPMIGRWISKPNLKLEIAKMADHSEFVGDDLFIRIPVSNGTRKQPAEAVEVFVESIRELDVQEPLDLPRYLPIRILWTHGVGPVCDRIAGGAYRLFDLGVLKFTINSETGFIAAVSARIDDENPVALQFQYEIAPTAGQIGLPSGLYTLTFLLACGASVKRQKVEIEIKRKHRDEGTKPSDFIRLA